MRILVRRKRGMLIVLTLIILALLTMFLAAGLSLSRAGANSTAYNEEQTLATEAAQAGVEYARTRLQEDPNWKGGTGDSVVVNTPGLWVRENRGNVIGIVGEGDRKAVFRIRFNYQNGSSTPDEGLANPAPDMVIRNAFVSENNLNAAVQKKVYRANSGGSWSVTSGSLSPYDCTRYSAVILCEGLAGAPLREVTPTQLAPAQTNRRLTRRVAEVFIGRNLNQIGDAPIYGAQDIQMTLKTAGQLKVRSSDHGVPPRARTLKDIYIQDPVGAAPIVDMTATGEAYVNQNLGVMKVGPTDSTAPVATQEDSKPRFPKITWSQIAKAPPTSTNLAAGTYVWRRSPRRLDYYAQEFDPLVGPPPATVTPDASYNSGGSLDPTGNISMDKNRLELDISQDLYVAPVGAVTGLAVVPEPGLLAAIQNRPNVELRPATSTSPAPIITAIGDIFVQGSLRGEGSVTTEGNITFQGTSILEADQNSRTAIYAKGDVTLEPLPVEIAMSGYTSNPMTGSGGGSGGGTPSIPFLSSLPAPPFGPPSFRDIAFSGLFYTQGSIKADFPGPTPADLYFRGMVVAFGGDPDLGQAPGFSGRGGIDFTGGNVYLEYDSRYVAGALNLTGAALLEVSSYNLF